MKNPDKKYWVGICPPTEAEDSVAKLKEELKQSIGWYHSVNSKAHITFCEFFDGMGKLAAMEKYLIEFCSGLERFKVTLTRAGRLHKAYCLYPDESSKDTLITLMRNFHSNKPFSTETKSIHPHVSIGRQLDEGKLAIAESLFGNRNFNIEFVCSRLTIRKFNPAKGQYDVYKQFEFGKPIANTE
ncbi:MAG: 2'-5' RNA ligase family protein [Chitinophagales bacterium]|nr:2'-5' RNA ligase family protein [Chitinophagales bacterium]